jgi:hypothetical protein
MTEELSRHNVVKKLRQLGLPQVAQEAERDLPDPVDPEHLAAFCERHGLSRGEMVDRMGGSP